MTTEKEGCLREVVLVRILLQALFVMILTAAASAQADTGIANAHLWSTGSYESDLAVGTAHFARVQASATLGIPDHQKENVSMTFLCLDGVTSLIIRWGGDVMGPKQDVTYRLGRGVPSTLSWDAGGQLTVLEQGAIPILGLLLMSPEKMLFIGVVSTTGIRTAMFDMSLLGVALRDVRRACRW